MDEEDVGERETTGGRARVREHTQSRGVGSGATWGWRGNQILLKMLTWDAIGTSAWLRSRCICSVE